MRAPSAESDFASCLPMPLPAPVMRAMRLAKSCMAYPSRLESVFLVPKLCLGTPVAKLCFVFLSAAAGFSPRGAQAQAKACGYGHGDGKQSSPTLRSQAELGNEGTPETVVVILTPLLAVGNPLRRANTMR